MNKTKLILPAVVTLALGLTVLIQTGCGKPAEDTPTATGAKQAVLYTCTMHPEVVQDKPGKCPKCEMALVVKK